MKLWIVGKYKSESLWEFMGVFDTEQAAVFQCLDEYYFIGPCTLNMKISNETVSWPGCYYPMSKVENVVLGDFNAS